jgi:large subunit ribosomal protein L23
MTNLSKIPFINCIKEPIISDKTTKILEDNQYCFKVSKSTNKNDVKLAIQYIFNVHVSKINILNLPIKKRTVGKTTGRKTQYKKAIVKLAKNDRINLFPEN